ncbi:acetate--CoA ligase family protein [Streptomyces sp. NPDC057582]|uniref:acetate--CoA ligase family protein n=1 Tax=Streptomyces sp. NPDC057582 TaxID=3346174 RepID=UPI003682A916
MSGPDRYRSQISALFDPKRIVVLGASATRVSDGNNAVTNLVRHGHKGKLSIVHPKATAPIQGVPTYRSAAELPERPDVALVSIPASGVLDALRDLDAIGCPVAVVPSAGFSTTQKAELRAFLREADIVFHGPNNMGVLNLTANLPLWFYDGMLTEDPAGTAALITQSGSASFSMRAAEGTGYSKVITTGNEYGLTTPDYMAWLAGDPDTNAVGLVLESIRDVPMFIAALKRLREADKPVVVMKVGRTASGSRLAAAHTEAIVSRDEFYANLFSKYDVPMARDYDELASALSVLTRRSVPRPKRKDLVFVTDSGGQAALIADIAQRQEIPLATYSAETRAKLEAVFPGLEVNNPLDAGGSPTAPDDHYAQALRILSQDPAVGAVAVVIEGQAQVAPIEFEYSSPPRNAMKELAATGFPVFGATSSTVSTSEAFRADLGPGIPLMRGYRNTAIAVEALAMNRAPWPTEPERPAHLPAPDELERLAKLFDAPGPISADAAARLLSAYGLEGIRSATLRDHDDVGALHGMRYPVVVKVLSRDVPHRADVGAVVVGVDDEDGVRAAIEQIRANVAATISAAVIDGFEVQPQVTEATEIAVGAIGDRALGGIVTVGSGGALVELYDDVATAAAPIDADQAKSLIASTIGGKLLAGYRRLQPATNLDALATLLVNVSWLVHDHHARLAAMDLNPVLVETTSGRTSIVDSLIIAAGAHPTAAADD